MKKGLLIAIAIFALALLALAFLINQELFVNHMYPQDTISESSNLTVRGKVTSIQQNHRTQGMALSNYHLFRWYFQLNITEAVWTSEEYLNSSIGDDTVFGSNTIGVGYDYSDNPQLEIGQEIECKGFYLGVTDTSFSFVLTVSPSVSESYLKSQN